MVVPYHHYFLHYIFYQCIWLVYILIKFSSLNLTECIKIISKLLSFSGINLCSEPWINVYWKSRVSHTMKCCWCVGKHTSAKKTIISIHKYFQNLLPYKCLMWSLPMIFRLIFALLTVYYQYHMAIFSSSHIEILVMNKIYCKNLYLFSLLTLVILELQCEGGQMTEVRFLSLQLFDAHSAK